MKWFRSETPRLLGLLAAITIVATGCVQPGDPKVGISRIEAELVFGVKPEEEPVATPATSVDRGFGDPVAPVADFGDFVPPSSNFELPEQEAKKPECPEAPRGAPAERVANVEVTADPPVGLYRWKVNASATQPDGSVRTAPQRFESRIVRRFQRVAEGHFKYETVQPVADGKFLVSYFDVYTDKFKANTTSPVGIVDSPASVGDPLRGLVLTRTETQNAQGLRDGPSFAPRDGILLLPLPVTAGESYQSVAVDPRGGSVVHDAHVRRVQRIDACGEVVDGWLVEATQRVTDNESQSTYELKYDYMVAPQYGAIMIMERIRDADETFDIAFQLGQLQPSPVPTAAQ